MNQEDVVRLTNQVFEDSFEIEKSKLVSGANIFSDLGLDSLDIVDLVVALQKKFGVVIRNDSRVRNIRTLGDIHQFILTIKQENEK